MVQTISKSKAKIIHELASRLKVKLPKSEYAWIGNKVRNIELFHVYEAEFGDCRVFYPFGEWPEEDYLKDNVVHGYYAYTLGELLDMCPFGVVIYKWEDNLYRSEFWNEKKYMNYFIDSIETQETTAADSVANIVIQLLKDNKLKL